MAKLSKCNGFRIFGDNFCFLNFITIRSHRMWATNSHIIFFVILDQSHNLFFANLFLIFIFLQFFHYLHGLP